MKPQRIQLRRSKGWRMPPNTVFVARRSQWGNPYKIGELDHSTGKLVRDAIHAVRLYRERCASGPIAKQEAIEQLRGKNLACYCPLDQPCHADILLEIANKDTP